jgi:hypothetical protein
VWLLGGHERRFDDAPARRFNPQRPDPPAGGRLLRVSLRMPPAETVSGFVKVRISLMNSFANASQ